MDKDELEFTNLCAELVSSREHERFVTTLLQKEKGEWFLVDALARAAGVDVSHFGPHLSQLFVTWLGSPINPADSTVILFYDREYHWTLGAECYRTE